MEAVRTVLIFTFTIEEYYKAKQNLIINIHNLYNSLSK
jgi:hypothetical protein